MSRRCNHHPAPTRAPDTDHGPVATATALEDEDDDSAAGQPALTKELTAAREEIVRLRVQLAGAEGRARTAEKVTEQRTARIGEQAARIKDLRLLLYRAWEGGQPVYLADPQVPGPAHPDQETMAGRIAQRLRKWFRG